ncbi:MAG TPA: hypothetical protein VFG79_21745 [Solirubrobacter sp.]|nr:hypothetical protein [Solirubrobacter sp.]
MEDVTYRDVTFPNDTIVLVCPHTGREPVYGTIDGIYGLESLPLRWSSPTASGRA